MRPVAFLRWPRLAKCARSIYTGPKPGDKGENTPLFNAPILLCSPVVVAMSGGVDSSVAARLLAEKVRR